MIERNLSFTIKKYYTDSNGNIISKASLSSDLQVQIPYYLFGNFDRDGYYSQAQRFTPTYGGWYFYNFYVSTSYDFLLISGANGIRSLIGLADLVFAYTDNVILPSYFCWVVISGGTQPIASIFDNLDGSMITKYIQMSSDSNRFNLDESINYITQNKLGDVKKQSYTPSQFVNEDSENPNIARIPLRMVLTKYFFISSYIYYDTDEMTYTLPLKIKDIDLNNPKDFIIE